MLEIIDRQTGYRVGKPYNDRIRARRRVDRLDNEYGAYRYYVRAIEANEVSLTDNVSLTDSADSAVSVTD